MSDRCFLALLDDVVSVWRPCVDVSPEGDPRVPVYEVLSEGVPCAVQPASGTLRGTVVGEVGLATHVAYLEVMDLQAGDLLVEELGGSTLSEAAQVGDVSITVLSGGPPARGDHLTVGEGGGAELTVAADVEGATVTLNAPLRGPHGLGERVCSVVAYEVLAARDESGLGHHLRAEARTVGT